MPRCLRSLEVTVPSSLLTTFRLANIGPGGLVEPETYNGNQP
jgi:hypothetical protein